MAITNLILHNIDSPRIRHGNALEQNVRDYREADRHDIILMNPPYGGSEQDIIKHNFPAELRSSETADLFIALAMYRLKTHGRAAIIIPDGFLFGNDGAKTALKTRLLTDYNLHTIIRLPKSVFAPYTSITTNILFFDKPAAGQTPAEQLWYYRVDIPADRKAFSKTKPMQLEHFADCIAWWHNRTEIRDEQEGSYKARAYHKAELLAGGANLDLCGYPNEEAEILSPFDTIRDYQQTRDRLNERIDAQLATIRALMGIDLPAEDE